MGKKVAKRGFASEVTVYACCFDEKVHAPSVREPQTRSSRREAELRGKLSDRPQVVPLNGTFYALRCTLGFVRRNAVEMDRKFERKYSW